MKARPPTRYFYTDPLAAAWMAKHHGVQFINVTKTIGLFEYEPLGVTVRRMFNAEVHPESMHLLEPHAGDLVDILGTWATVTDKHVEKQRPLVTIELARDAVIPPRIIQRNGKVFHWPEGGS